MQKVPAEKWQDFQKGVFNLILARYRVTSMLLKGDIAKGEENLRLQIEIFSLERKQIGKQNTHKR